MEAVCSSETQALSKLQSITTQKTALIIVTNARNSGTKHFYTVRQRPSLQSNTNLRYHILTDSEHSSSLLLFGQLHEGSHPIYNFLTELFNGLQQKLGPVIPSLVPKEERYALCGITSLSL
jgi:hypothetical protein